MERKVQSGLGVLRLERRIEVFEGEDEDEKVEDTTVSTSSVVCCLIGLPRRESLAGEFFGTLSGAERAQTEAVIVFLAGY